MFGAPELRRQQMAAAEDVKRQVAVAVVVAMEEPPLLVAVQRVVGGVEIEHDLLRRAGRGRRGRAPRTAPRSPRRRGRSGGSGQLRRGAVLEPVERALAGERRAAAVPRLQAAEHHPEHRVVAQPVVVDQVLIAERDAEHPLPDQRRHLVDHPLRRPAVGEAGREALDQPDRPVGRPEQQPARVRRDRAAIEIRHHRTAIDRCESHRLRATLCRHRGDSPAGTEVFVAEALSHVQGPDAPTPCEKCGLMPSPGGRRTQSCRWPLRCGTDRAGAASVEGIDTRPVALPCRRRSSPGSGASSRAWSSRPTGGTRPMIGGVSRSASVWWTIRPNRGPGPGGGGPLEHRQVAVRVAEGGDREKTADVAIDPDRLPPSLSSMKEKTFGSRTRTGPPLAAARTRRHDAGADDLLGRDAVDPLGEGPHELDPATETMYDLKPSARGRPAAPASAGRPGRCRADGTGDAGPSPASRGRWPRTRRWSSRRVAAAMTSAKPLLAERRQRGAVARRAARLEGLAWSVQSGMLRQRARVTRSMGEHGSGSTSAARTISVPSLSKVAMRSATGTKSGPPSSVTLSTKARIAGLGRAPRSTTAAGRAARKARERQEQ